MNLPEILIAADEPEALKALGVALRAGLSASGADDAAIRSLFDGQSHAAEAFDDLLGAPGIAGLKRFGLLEASATGALQSLLSLRLLDGLLIATDLPRPHRHVPDTYVDPLWEGAGLARLLDVPEGGLALDMGTGCGVLALTMARKAAQVYAVDVNPRALSLTRFNAGLNGLANVDVRHSDLFAAVEGLRFDIIAFNSPTGEEFTSDNLQHAGEAILERFFRQVSLHLTDRGTIQISLCGKDWTGELFMARIERFLGISAPRYQFVFLENWRTVRGRIFFWRRLTASLRLGINAFNCKAFMKGWLVISPGPAGESWQVSTDYHDWVQTEPAGAAPALVAALRSRSPSGLPARLQGLIAHSTPIARQMQPVRS